MNKSGVDVPSWMLSLKPASSKRWREVEKRPIKRKTISTDIDKNENKRYVKMITKDTKRLQKLSRAQKVDEEPEDQVENWKSDSEKLGSDVEFGDDESDIEDDM